MLLYSEQPCEAAAMFTKHSYCGACVQVGKKHIADGRLQAIVAVSGIANVATGDTGVTHAMMMCNTAATELGISQQDVLPSATGIIGYQLPIEKIVDGLRDVKSQLDGDPMAAARAIMTTDKFPKVACRQFDGVTMTGIAKGAGMIEPNMATMLVYILTDAKIPSSVLKTCLHNSVHKTFNMLSIDSDTSTSDTAVLMANGCSKAIGESTFQRMLDDICLELTTMMQKSAEGATKLLTVQINGAITDLLAKQVAKSVVNSPLVKTMVYGCDPNVGRLIMAIGKICDPTLRIEDLSICLNGHDVITHGLINEFPDEVLRKEMARESILIEASIGQGIGSARAFGCDLTEGYIEENAAYSSS